MIHKCRLAEIKYDNAMCDRIPYYTDHANQCDSYPHEPMWQLSTQLNCNRCLHSLCNSWLYWQVQWLHRPYLYVQQFYSMDNCSMLPSTFYQPIWEYELVSVQYIHTRAIVCSSPSWHLKIYQLIHRHFCCSHKYWLEHEKLDPYGDWRSTSNIAPTYLQSTRAWHLP